MVDALRRANEWVTAGGWIVDIHPTAMTARVEVGSTIVGPIDPGDAPLRHEAATLALDAAVRAQLVRMERQAEFDFYTYGDSAEELAEYIEENWRSARIDGRTIARTRAALLAAPGAKPRILERVRLTVLRPGGSAPSIWQSNER
jgi:hypothetical protein